jgi:hypothetical protein
MDTTLSPTPSWRYALRPLITARGYAVLAHHLLGLVLGTAYFTWFVTGLATGFGLAITLNGIPLLTLVLASVRPLLAAERAMANAMLGTELEDEPLVPGGEGVIGRFKAYWRDTATWRGMAYLLLRFPVGTFTFAVAVATYGGALFLIAAPVVAPFDTIEFGIWETNTVLEGLALVPAGLALLFVAGWISEGMAGMSRGLARWGTA